MCLTLVTETYNPPLMEEREAWKCFEVLSTDGTLYSDYNRNPIRGKWMKTTKHPVRSADGRMYESGFHAFTTLEAAIRYAVDWERVFKVRIRGIRVVGQQHSGDVLVADEMFIPTRAKGVAK